MQERLRPGALVALLLSIVGVGLITGARVAGIGRGDAMGLLAGLTGGVAITSIRELRKTETAYAILVVFCAFGLVTSLLMAREPWLLPRGGMLWALGGIAVMGTGGQLLMTAAYRYCSVAAGGLLSLVTVVLSSLIGFLWFGEGMSLRTLAGSLLVLGAAAYLTLLEAGSFRRSRAGKDTGPP
jgi:S-adenosylmethionine uptake transporter